MPDLEHARPSTICEAAWQTAYRLGFPLARIWWRMRRQRHEGALVAVHIGQALLLLRSSYRIAWNSTWTAASRSSPDTKWRLVTRLLGTGQEGEKSSGAAARAALLTAPLPVLSP